MSFSGSASERRAAIEGGIDALISRGEIPPALAKLALEARTGDADARAVIADLVEELGCDPGGILAHLMHGTPLRIAERVVADGKTVLLDAEVDLRAVRFYSGRVQLEVRGSPVPGVEYDGRMCGGDVGIRAAGKTWQLHGANVTGERVGTDVVLRVEGYTW